MTTPPPPDDSVLDQVKALRSKVDELEMQLRHVAAHRVIAAQLVVAVAIATVGLFLPWSPAGDDFGAASAEFSGAGLGWSFLLIEPWSRLEDGPENTVVGLAMLLSGVGALPTIVLAVATAARGGIRLIGATYALSLVGGVPMAGLLCVWLVGSQQPPAVGYFATASGIIWIVAATGFRHHQLHSGPGRIGPAVTPRW